MTSGILKQKTTHKTAWGNSFITKKNSEKHLQEYVKEKYKF